MLESVLQDFLDNGLCLQEGEPVAIAVSGGPDSMALAQALLTLNINNPIHILTVDHKLRAASSREAWDVKEWVSKYKRNDVYFNLLSWEGDKPTSALLEKARQVRYDLMATYCAEHKIKHLFLAHHKNDQAETFLIRLAKGSGLDGLAAMKSTQDYKDTITLCRPLLGLLKQDLVQYCEENKIAYAQDPTNENEDYLRPRLRQSFEALEKEGLSVDRLATLSKRLQRARAALEEISQKAFDTALKEKKEDTVRIDFNITLTQTEEIAFRMLIKATRILREEAPYNIRMDRLENLFEDLYFNPSHFKSRTLGGLKFSITDKNTVLCIEKEKKKK